MLLAGLTGNYGMGKSTVLKMFRDLGAYVLETDNIVDTLLNDPPVLEKIRAVFGSEVFAEDGKLDRTRVAYIIFKDDAHRDAIEGILHPLVFDRITAFLKALGKSHAASKIAIIEIPLMFEKNYEAGFHKTITVYTDNATALERLEQRGIRREDAVLRLNVQRPVEEKVRRSDFAINNSGNLKETKALVKEIYKELMLLSQDI